MLRLSKTKMTNANFNLTSKNQAKQNTQQKRKELTFPDGNFFKKASDLLVSPKTKSEASLTFAEAYCAAISAL